MRFLRALVLLLAVLAAATTAPAAQATVQATVQAPGTDRGGVGGPSLDLPLAVGAGAPPLPAITAATFLVADLDSGEVLAAQGAHVPHAPASTLKVLTALTLIPRIPADAVLVPSQASANVDGSKVGLAPGFGYPAKEVFEALEMASGNDAAEVLAEWSGDRATTLRWMNAEAARLQAYDTVAMTPSGLDAPGQQSTAYDLALIARAALALPDFAAYATTLRSTVSAPDGSRYEIYNHNRLLTRYEGSLGVKGGYTNAARASFVAAAERDGRRVLTTLMRTNDGPLSQRESAALMDWGFAAMAAGAPAVGTLVDPVDVIAEREAAEDAAAERARALLPDFEVTELPGQAVAATGDAVAASVRPVLSMAVALLVVAALLRVRAVRRRRRRPRSRLTLPRG